MLKIILLLRLQFILNYFPSLFTLDLSFFIVFLGANWLKKKMAVIMTPPKFHSLADLSNIWHISVLLYVFWHHFAKFNCVSLSLNPSNSQYVLWISSEFEVYKAGHPHTASQKFQKFLSDLCKSLSSSDFLKKV